MDSVQINKKLTRLKLPGIATTIEQRISQANTEKWAYSMFLETLLTDEIERRNNKQFQKKLAKSQLDLTKTLETFDFKFNPKLQVALIRELALCRFVENKQIE